MTVPATAGVAASRSTAEGRRAQAFADAQAGAEQELDEVGQVLARRRGIGGQPRLQQVGFFDGERLGTSGGACRAPGGGDPGTVLIALSAAGQNRGARPAGFAHEQ
jgi:hypothetical protein